MKTAVYAGSFDPLTNGHLWMIQEGARLFDQVVVAIGINPDKKCAFSLEERVEMLRKSTRTFPNVKVDSFENQFLVQYAHSIGAQYMLRGIRTEGDYEYERGMRYVNSDLNPNIVTDFLMPPREIVEVSSSLVKGLVGPQGWEEVVEGYVPRNVYNKFLVKYGGLQGRWKELWQRCGARGEGKEEYDELVALYGEPQRAYHNLVHIAHVLRELDQAKSLLENQEQVEMGLWYHDSIYNTRKKDNVEKSTALAQQRLSRAGVRPSFIEGVTALILPTEHQVIPSTADGKHLVDMDLSILGKPELEFDEYELDIREEYAWVPEEQFKVGRRAILHGFLEREHIYSTDFFRQRYEIQAQKNIERSMAQLGLAIS